MGNIVEIYDTISGILNAALEAGISFKVGRTHEDSFLIYTKRDADYMNLEIDMDGDVSFLRIARNVQDAKAKVFFREDGLPSFRFLAGLLIDDSQLCNLPPAGT